MNISLFMEHIFVFLPMPHKMFFVVKNLCANIECPDLHAKFIFIIFWHLKFVFLCIFYNRFIYTWEPKHLLLLLAPFHVYT
jgi:hypothetical protein